MPLLTLQHQNSKYILFSKIFQIIKQDIDHNYSIIKNTLNNKKLSATTIEKNHTQSRTTLGKIKIKNWKWNV